MLQSKARWKLSDADPALVDALVRELGLHPVIAKMLAARGIADKTEAELFLYGGKDHFYDPFLLDGMDLAVERIRRAILNGEKIRVYGDYDADGVSSTALMIHLFRQLGANFDHYIPHRTNEGYGLNEKALDMAKQSGVSLIVTVDTGISAREQVAYAAELGMDVVVTDHHEPPERLPDAVAVINPKKPGCPYPFKQLAGVGVAFKLAHALTGKLPEHLLEIAAIGTVADLMPLVGENRIIVKLGLERMRSASYPGIRALFDVSGISGQEVTAAHLGFALAPRINASGRLDHAGDAVRLLTTADADEAAALAQGLDRLNKERQRIVDEMTKEALEMIDRAVQSAGDDNVIVLAKEDWNVGVIGIVAAKLLERFYRPTVVLGIDPSTGMAKGSARSIVGFDMYKALTQCADLLDHYGGHQAAAGMTLHRERLDEFRRRLNRLAGEWLTAADYIPLYTADADFSLADVTIERIRQIETLAPFGMGNPSPRFVLNGLALREKRTLGKDRQHLKLVLGEAAGETDCAIEALAFGRGGLSELISTTASIDVLGELGINEWNGIRKPQIVVHDMRIPHVQVFDWRGVRQAEAKFAEVAAFLRDASGGSEPLRAIVVDAERPYGGLDPDRIDCGLWAMDAAEGAVPLNDEAKRFAFEAAEDVLLYSLPSRIEALQRTLAGSGAWRVYAGFADWDRDYAAMPSREAFKLLYQAVLRQSAWEEGDLSFAEPLRRNVGATDGLIRFMLDVFEELEFIEKRGGRYACIPSPRKRDLNESPSYRNRLARAEAEQTLIYSTARELTDWILAQLQQKPKRMMEVVG